MNVTISKLKLGIKNRAEVTLNLLSNMIEDSNDEIDFLHKLLLTDRHVSRIYKAWANGSSTNKKRIKK